LQKIIKIFVCQAKIQQDILNFSKKLHLLKHPN